MRLEYARLSQLQVPGAEVSKNMQGTLGHVYCNV